eukprot:comp13358_c1_seq1/m.8814 comp13358_c1_seq1/g.8814  ORF comp13358_c1_seq1/g.8814 comp13358_c1_seq1/m.8814 type:complete len:439 (-) comp13358_c1_seq1:229-1545(-)
MADYQDDENHYGSEGEEEHGNEPHRGGEGFGEEQPTNTCPICLEALSGRLSATSCGHVFHTYCLERWLQTNKNCPQCKGPVSKRYPTIRLFLGELLHTAPTNEDLTRDADAGLGVTNVSTDQLTALYDRAKEAEAKNVELVGQLQTVEEDRMQLIVATQRLTGEVSILQAKLRSAEQEKVLSTRDKEDMRAAKEAVEKRLESASRKIELLKHYEDLVMEKYSKADEHLAMDPSQLPLSLEQLRVTNAYLSREMRKIMDDMIKMRSNLNKAETRAKRATEAKESLEDELRSQEAVNKKQEDDIKAMRKTIERFQKKGHTAAEEDFIPSAQPRQQKPSEPEFYVHTSSRVGTGGMTFESSKENKPTQRPVALDPDMALMAKKTKPTTSGLLRMQPYQTKSQLSHNTINKGFNGMGGSHKVFSAKTQATISTKSSVFGPRR